MHDTNSPRDRLIFNGMQYIILEFMENGALSSIIKQNKFGPFPEALVAVYTQQVLQVRLQASHR